MVSILFFFFLSERMANFSFQLPCIASATENPNSFVNCCFHRSSFDKYRRSEKNTTNLCGIYTSEKIQNLNFSREQYEARRRNQLRLFTEINESFRDSASSPVCIREKSTQFDNPSLSQEIKPKRRLNDSRGDP
ncbi:hypothetical protein NE237_004579 [Protea cynaroides]|uniref:Secreted protein n=1 Tax=Protea cynaroides TaxID=273540 RepID=A0A9Q0KJ82_9MAGN|nr:hypothetical protein NE237_004579 [Protea cynaroides]